MTSRIGLIPARGGSQRVPRKNVREFAGIPAIARVIRTLQDSDLFDRIIVSTDDDEISTVAMKAGAECPFVRPAELSDSLTGTRPVIQHAVHELGLAPSDEVAVIYATAVLISAEDIRRSFALFESGTCDFLLAVAEFPAPVERGLRVSAEQQVSPVSRKHTLARSQDLARAYYDIGQFYWGQAGTWATSTPVVQARTLAYVVDSWRAVDIDTPDDWHRAELVHRMINEMSR